MSWVESFDGLAMVVDRLGEGPPLIWIHGLGDSSRGFRALAAAAAFSGWAHALVDLPGYGRSQWSDAPDSLERLADRLAGWVAAAGSAAVPPVLLGHSMGGVLAQLIAERVTVRAIVDVEGNLSRGDCNFSARAAAYSLADFVDHGLDAMCAHTREAGRGDLALLGYHMAMCAASPEAFHRHAVDLVRMSETETLASRLAALSVPVLYVAGVPNGICARSRSLLDSHGIHWVGLEPAAHWVHLDQPAAFASAVTGFLREA